MGYEGKYGFKCDICGAHIDFYNETGMDDMIICGDCKHTRYPGKWKDGRWIVDGSLYRISATFSSMYEGGSSYATTLEKATGGAKCVAVHKKADPMLFNWGFGLSGHIDSDHWEIYTNVKWPHHAHIYNPSETELEKLKAVEITEEELKKMRDDK